MTQKIVICGILLLCCSAKNGPGQQMPMPAAQAARINALRQRAEQGDAKAQADLGGMYRQGAGVKQDYSEALHWLRKAANQGNSAGRFELGQMYLEGQGVDQNYVEAARWLGCPELDKEIISSCQFTDVPQEARSLLLREKCDRSSVDSGLAVKLQNGETPAYQVCCHWPPHGLCNAVVIARINGKWKDVTISPGGAEGFDRCIFFLPLKGQHNGFHDVCLPNQCTVDPGSYAKSCVPEVWQFSDGRYHAVPSSAAASSH
jgi:hypothetical protein